MKPKNLLLSLFILLKFLLQYIAIHPEYTLHRDEFLHLDLGRHLAWGYTTVPPLTGLLSSLIIALGASVFWVKFFPALFGVLTLFVTWKIIEELEGGIFALVLGAVGVICSALLRINTLYQPNSLEYLLWTAVFFGVIKYVKQENVKWIWFTALALAIGFLNKYNISFLMAGMFLGLLISPQRRVFGQKHLYLAFSAALLMVIPNLFWQYEFGFPVIKHMGKLVDTQLVNVERLGFIKDQFLFFFGSLITIFAAFVGLLRFRPFRDFRFVLWTYLSVVILYLVFRGKSYYAIGLYPVLLAFGSVYLEKSFEKGAKGKLKWVFVAIPIIIMFPLFRITVPVQSPEQIMKRPGLYKSLGLLRWEDGRDHHIPQDFADMLGWDELGELVDEAMEKVEDKNRTLIHCDNYGEAGAINFYATKHVNEALTLDADYLYWYPLEDFEIENVVLVQGPWDDDPGRKRETPWFETVELIGEITHPFAREKGTKVYLLKGAKRSINAILSEEIQKRTAME